jgi:hypothetical protein
MQHGLALPPPAVDVSLVALLPNGRDVRRDATPPQDLSRIVARPAAHVVRQYHWNQPRVSCQLIQPL